MAPLSQRLDSLRTDVMQRKGSFLKNINRCLYHVASWKARGANSAIEFRSEFLYQLVATAKLDIYPGWTLCGEHLCEPVKGSQWPAEKEEVASELAKLGIPADLAEEIRTTPVRWGRGKSRFSQPVYEDSQKGLGRFTSYEDKTTRQPEMVYWSMGWIENHSIRDFAKAIKLGFGGIKKEVENQIAQTDIADPDLPEKENFWQAAIRLCDAGLLLGKRYAELATRKAAEAEDAAAKQRFEKMAATCAKIGAGGAESLYEATQMLWLTHVLTCGEDGINANSIGRLDQILWPYYQADLTAGRLDRDGARDLMIELALKLYLEYDVQAITLGGCDSQGNDAVNELSYLILEATEAADFVRDLSVRLHPNTPEDFRQCCSSLIVKGGGIPFLFNDECYIKALTDRGIALEDARDYAPIGCVELTIPGKANPHAVSGWFCSTKCIEFAMNNGKAFATGDQVGPQTGDFRDFNTFEEFYTAYARQVDFFARRMAYNINRNELNQQRFGPLPMWSVLTDDCIARGRDITDQGAKYNYHSICLIGAPNTADSLFALKKLYFEEKSVGDKELLDALAKDFQGHESLRKKLLNEVEKYGNNADGVDALAQRVCNDFIDLMDTFQSPLGGRYFVHLFSFYCNLNFGRQLWATPDGRNAGAPIAYSLSASQGRDLDGVTAMLSSLAKMPHDKAAGGSAAIIELDPKMVAGRQGATLMSNLIETAFRIGIGQLQWNVVTAERLRQAQQDPEKYGNISVRVSGFSQMFKLLGPSLQDHIIERTKHTH